MYFSSARVSDGRDGAAGRETAAATSRREVASRATAMIAAPTRTTKIAASATSVRRETFGGRVSADGIIRLVSVRCEGSYAISRRPRCQRQTVVVGCHVTSLD